MIREHEYMVLREADFSTVRINWHNKADNLREIAEELNIGLDSMVFIDNDPKERELVRQLLPEVLVVDLPADPARYRLTLEELSDFELLAVTKEDEARTAQYRAQRQRQVLRETQPSLEGYFRSLNIAAEIGPAERGSVPRLVQMFSKTNQLNATTRRYQSADVERFLSASDYHVYAVRASDRFGDHGLVGTAVVQEEATHWRIDSLLLSCRAMGLGVETALLHRIRGDAERAGADVLIGEVFPTKKNRPAQDLYSRHGFVLLGEKDGQQEWGLDVRRHEIPKPDWIGTV